MADITATTQSGRIRSTASSGNPNAWIDTFNGTNFTVNSDATIRAAIDDIGDIGVEFSLDRGYIQFDTSSIASTSTINSASLAIIPSSIAGTSFNVLFDMLDTSYGTLTSDDWDQSGQVSNRLATEASSDFTVDTTKTFIFDSDALTDIKKGASATTDIWIRSVNDVLSPQPGQDELISFYGPSHANAPVLTITLDAEASAINVGSTSLNALTDTVGLNALTDTVGLRQ